MLPKTISGRYKLYKQEELRGQSSSKKGVYLDKITNNLVFIKIDTNIKSLFREYAYQQFFYKQSKKIRNQDIIIPKPLEILKTDNYTALVMEYFPAKSLVKANIKTRVDAYMKVLRFLEKINNIQEAERKGILREKTAMAQLITLPYFLLKNLMYFKSYTYSFLRATSFITRFASKWKKLDSNWICHGDINVTNVLLYGKKVIILDFACSYKSHRYYDISRVLNSAWYQVKFHQQLWNRIVRDLCFTTHQQGILKSFVVFNLMQRLSQRYANLSQERFYLKRLGMIITSL